MLDANNGGTILATNLSSISGVFLYLGANSTMALGRLNSISNTRSGTTITLNAYSGAVLNLSSVRQMLTVDTGTTIAVNSYGGAAGAALVDLSGLTNISSGPLNFYANSAGSVINLSNLLTFNAPGLLQQSNGGLILLNTNATYQSVSLQLAPVVTTQPQSATLFTGPTNFSFSVSVSGTAPLAYQWYLNQTNLVSGATNSALTFYGVNPAKSGSYTVLITNSFGSVTSAPAYLQVAQPLTVANLGRGTVTFPPTNYTIGSTVTLNATNAGRWYQFLQWSDGNTNPIRTITVTASNNFYTAVFTNTVPLEPVVLEQWEQDYGGPGDDLLYAVQQTSDGGYILGGISASGISGNKSSTNYGGYDYWVIKVDMYGNKQWDKTFGGSGNDYLTCLVQTFDGGYMLGGYSSSSTGGTKTAPNYGGTDIWLVRLDSAGNQLWDASYGGANDDKCNSIVQTPDGGYIIGGYSLSAPGGNKTAPNFGGNDFWQVKIDVNGNKLWDSSFGGNNHDLLIGLLQTVDGGCLLSGLSESAPSGNKTSDYYGGSYDGWFVKTDGNGNKQWENDVGGTGSDVIVSALPTSDGGFIADGYSSSPPSGNKTSTFFGVEDAWLVRLDANGNKLWDQSFGSPGGASFANGSATLCLTLDGGYALGGYSPASPGGNKTSSNQGKNDYWIIGTDANGNKVWDYSFGGTNDDWCYSMQTTSDGGFIMAGTSASGVSGTKLTANYGADDFWVVKTSDGVQPVGTPDTLVNGLYSISNSFAIPATNTITVTLQSSFTNGYIYYTLDGTHPTPGNDGTYEYLGPDVGGPFPFILTNSTVVTAAAFSSDDTGNVEVDANPVNIYVVPVYALTNTTPGGGSVAFNPPGGIYLSNTTVTVTATATNGWTFMNWQGLTVVSNNPVTVTINSSTNLTAVFGTGINTTTNTPGTSVALWPASGPYAYGSTVRLVAEPNATNRFNRWFSNISGPTNNPLAITVLTANTNINAFFTTLPANNFTLTVLLNGSGTVTRAPSPNSYASNTVVALTAVPDTGYVFTGWSGGASGTANPLSVTMTTTKVITANFASAVPPTFTTQPQSLTVNRDSNAVLSVTATGPLLAYQWQHAGTNIPGATSASYSIASAQKADGGNYQVIVTNIFGAATSSVAVLTVDLPYTFITLAGTATNAGSADGIGGAAQFNSPYSVAVDSSNYVYVADYNNHIIRKITLAGVVTTWAGLAGNPGSTDGTGSIARFNYPNFMAVDNLGNLYVSDNANHTIRHVTSDGNVNTFAGLAGNSGSTDGSGSAARFYYPGGLAVDGTGNIYVADTFNNTIRKISSSGVVTTLAGTAGQSGSADGAGSVARFQRPQGCAVDSQNNVYVADYWNHTIRKISPAGVVSTLAGSAGITGNTDGIGNGARFNYPFGLAIDGAGNLYVGDTGNGTIRKVTPAGVVTTLAGQAGSVGSVNGPALSARFNEPCGLAVDIGGDIYVAEQINNTIRKGIPDYGQPIIYAQPQSVAVNRDSNTVLSVSATFNGTTGFQWQHNGTNIFGATSSNLVFASAQKADGGNYAVVITNSFGAATSSVAVLTVNLP